MTYLEKVKASKGLLEAINALGDKDSILLTYGTDYNGKPQEYKISCSIFRDGKPSYSIYKNEVFALSGMNFSEFTSTQGKAYTFDMMGQRSTFNFPLYEMSIVEVEEGIEY